MDITTAAIVQRFRASGQKVPCIVYDVDDVMWDLIGRVANEYGIEPQRAAAIFSIRDNPHLTPQEQDIIIAAFSNPAIFRNIDFFPGVADILRPCELGARVSINSNSFNPEIAQLKRKQLLAAIPGLRPEDLKLNIINYGATHRKEFTPGMTILIDDSSHNVALSPAIVNVMPTTVRWAYSETAKQMVQDQPVIWQPNLVAINQYIYDLVAAMMATAA